MDANSFLRYVDAMPDPYRTFWEQTALVDSDPRETVIACPSENFDYILKGAVHFRIAAKARGHSGYIRLRVQCTDGEVTVV